MRKCGVGDLLLCEEQENTTAAGFGANIGASESGAAGVIVEMVSTEARTQKEGAGGGGDDGGAGEDAEEDGEVSQKSSKKSGPLNMATRLRIMDDCSEEDRHAASPGNRLDEIMDGVEKRSIVVMTGLREKYALATIKGEVDRDFSGDYSLIGLAPENIIVVALRTPLVVMRFAAQFKIERWSHASPGSTVTDSGTVVELEAPNVEYCKIQDQQEVIALLNAHGMPYLRPNV